MNTRKHRVVIVGGGYAGLMAAARIGRENKAEVTLVDGQPSFTHRIRLHETLAGAAPKTFGYARSLSLHIVTGRTHGVYMVINPAKLGVSTG